MPLAVPPLSALLVRFIVSIAPLAAFSVPAFVMQRCSTHSLLQHYWKIYVLITASDFLIWKRSFLSGLEQTRQQDNQIKRKLKNVAFKHAFRPPPPLCHQRRRYHVDLGRVCYYRRVGIGSIKFGLVGTGHTVYARKMKLHAFMTLSLSQRLTQWNAAEIYHLLFIRD